MYDRLASPGIRHSRTAISIGLLCLVSVRASADEPGHWPAFRGARVDGVSNETGIFAERGTRLRIAWKMPLGAGYSGIAIAAGRAVTMASDGSSDLVVALDAESGKELWRYPIGDTYRGHDGSKDGPIATPCIAGSRVFALGPRGKLAALRVETGEEIWSSDLAADHGAVKPHWGFGTSPIVLNNVLVVQTGAKNAMVSGFDPATGRKLWSAGDDVVYYQTPVPFEVAGRQQLLVAGNSKLIAVDPATGRMLWETTHDGSGERGSPCLVPVPVAAPDGSTRVLLKHLDDRSMLLEPYESAGRAAVRKVWEAASIGKSFAVAVVADGMLFGFNGRTATCVDPATGQTRWRSREPGDGFMIAVDRHLVTVTKDGAVHVGRADPGEYRAVAQAKVFDELCWTPPSFAGGSIFVRSFSEIARVAIDSGASAPLAGDATDPALRGTSFARLLDTLRGASDKAAEIDRFLAAQKSFPLIEPDGRVIFVYRGPGNDLVLGGDITGFGDKRPMPRVAGTDLFYCVARMEPDARVAYAFVRDFKAIPDPLNPRRTTATGFDDDLDFVYEDARVEMSWFAMPQWKPPTHLEPVDPSRRGRIESLTFKSAALDRDIELSVYLPHGYGPESPPLPVAYLHDGRLAREELRVPEALDNLIGRRMAPVLAVFIHHAPSFFDDQTAYARMAAVESAKVVDEKYRTIRARDGRAHIGASFGGVAVLNAAFNHGDLVGKVGAQSPLMINLDSIRPVMKQAADTPLVIYLDWCKYDARSRLEGWNLPAAGRGLDRLLRDHGYTPRGGEAHDGSGVSSWQNRIDDLLESLFPL